MKNQGDKPCDHHQQQSPCQHILSLQNVTAYAELFTQLLEDASLCDAGQYNALKKFRILSSNVNVDQLDLHFKSAHVKRHLTIFFKRLSSASPFLQSSLKKEKVSTVAYIGAGINTTAVNTMLCKAKYRIFQKSGRFLYDYATFDVSSVQFTPEGEIDMNPKCCSGKKESECSLNMKMMGLKTPFSSGYVQTLNAQDICEGVTGSTDSLRYFRDGSNDPNSVMRGGSIDVGTRARLRDTR